MGLLPIQAAIDIFMSINGCVRIRFKVLIISLLIASVDGYADPNMAILNDPAASAQYSMGYFITTTEELEDITIDNDALMMGIKDTLNGQLQLTPEEMQQALKNLGQSILQKKNTTEARMEAYRDSNQSFLQVNKTKMGIVITDSGLQYQILTAGNGASPTLNDRVLVHYKGSLINGQEFESSYRKDEPASFSVSEVISGWSEALQIMRTGSKWRLFIPPELAYADKGVEHLIPPDSTLILDVELLAIN